MNAEMDGLRAQAQARAFNQEKKLDLLRNDIVKCEFALWHERDDETDEEYVCIPVKYWDTLLERIKR